MSTNPKMCEKFYMSDNSYEQDQFSKNIFVLKNGGVVCDEVVFAWGNFEVVKKRNVDKELSKMFPNAKALKINKNGSPKHPLYCSSNTKIIPYVRS